MTVHKTEVTAPVYRWECDGCDDGDTAAGETPARTKRLVSRMAETHSAQTGHDTSVLQLLRLIRVYEVADGE